MSRTPIKHFNVYATVVLTHFAINVSAYAQSWVVFNAILAFCAEINKRYYGTFLITEPAWRALDVYIGQTVLFVVNACSIIVEFGFVARRQNQQQTSAPTIARHHRRVVLGCRVVLEMLTTLAILAVTVVGPAMMSGHRVFSAIKPALVASITLNVLTVVGNCVVYTWSYLIEVTAVIDKADDIEQIELEQVASEELPSSIASHRTDASLEYEYTYDYKYDYTYKYEYGYDAASYCKSPPPPTPHSCYEHGDIVAIPPSAFLGLTRRKSV